MGSKPGRRAAAAAAHALLLLAAFPSASAHPYPRDDLHDIGYAYLMARDCDTYCGADNQYCCGSGEVCFTTNNIAGCSAANGQGNYVTTWTQTQTFTSTVATSWAAAPTSGSDGGDDCVPDDDSATSCGSICCASWQYCAYKGQCLARDGASVPVSTYTTNGQITTRFTQAYRITDTSTAGASATAIGSEGDQNGNDDGGGLSGGAIAGIVIGSIAGVALLMLLCFCCVVRGLWAMLCGGGRDKDSDRRTATTTEDQYSRRDSHHEWYGGAAGGAGRRASASRRRDSGVSKKDKGENKFLLAMTAIVSTLAALLFLKRGKKKEKQSEKSRSTTTTSRSRSTRSRPRYTGSWSGSDSDITASTETGYSRRTRGTRATRHTHSSRRPRDRDF